MPLPPQNQLAWKISITLVHSLSLSSTVVRIWHRWRIGRAWWDDYILAIPWSIDLVYIVSMWTKYQNHDISWDAPGPGDKFIYSIWFQAFLYFTEIWFSRISLSLSIARIFLPGHQYRIWAFIFAVILFLLYLTSLLITTFCCSGTPWWNLNFNNCVTAPFRISVEVATVVRVTVDFAADAVLVAAPLIMFWKIDFPRPQRILVLVLFSSSIITMVASMLYCTVWYAAARFGPDSGLLFIMMSHFQSTLSLLVCNFLVVTMLVYSKLRGSEEILLARERERRAADAEKVTTREIPRITVDADHFTTTVPSYTVIPLSSISNPPAGSSGQLQASSLSSGLISRSDANASSNYSNSFLIGSRGADSSTS